MNALITKKLSQLTIGSDPEIFVSLKNGQIKSSIPILKKDKNNPIKLDNKQGVNLYADNSLAEFSFNPCRTKREFINRYRVAFKNGQKFLGEKYRLRVKSAHFFKDNELEAAFGIDPQQIGCSPEYDFYEVKMKNLGAFENSMRSGSSHLHVGHPDLTDFDLRHEALKTLEIYLGCASIIWDKDPSSKVRRQKYGLAGSFRPTDYGFEARFMSNYMLNSPKLVGLTYDIIKYTLSHVFKGTHKKILTLVKESDVQRAINLCDKLLAKKILLRAKFPQSLFNRVIVESRQKYGMKTFYSNWGI